jgi:LysM repeat protein
MTTYITGITGFEAPVARYGGPGLDWMWGKSGTGPAGAVGRYLSSFGGGGGSLSMGSFISNALRSDFGGTWSNGGGHLFGSNDEAFDAGYSYNTFHNSWGNTFLGTAQGSANLFADLSRLQNPDYMLARASLDGPLDNRGVPPGEYEVRRGDSFRSIAKKSGISKSDLLRINNMSGNEKIYSGDVLKVDKAFVRFEEIMDTRIRYLGRNKTLGDTPYGGWLRGELDNRRGFVNGEWSSYESEWRSLKWIDFVPAVLSDYPHIYSEQWRSSGWALRAFTFDKFLKR